MAQKIKTENGTNSNCFVPTCANRKSIDGNQIHFFQVPLGNEGLRWKVAVNSDRTQHERRIGILRRNIPPTTLHCCELHFNIETDSIVTIDANGSVECNIKPGVFPSIKPTRSKRLWEIVGNENIDTFQEMDCDNTANYWPRPMKLDTAAATPNSDFISIVDMSTIICKKFNDETTQDEDNGFDDQLDIKFSPLMPLTVELMRRKSLYYMGLEGRLFFRLMRIVKRTMIDTADLLMEMKIMLTLRKHRLNEEFEALGDLFDIDKTTAQRYYAESKDLVFKLYHSLTNSVSSPIHQESNHVKNPLLSESPQINVDHRDDQVDDGSLSEPEMKYKGYVTSDSDIHSDDFKDSDFDAETDDCDFGTESEDFDNSDVEPGEVESKETLSDCPICGHNVRWLDNHIKNTHWYPQYLNKTVCGLCFGKFPSHQKLRDHQTADHNGSACMCDVCGKMFKKFSDTKKHILQVHSKVKPFLCHLCGESYYEECKLKVHMDRAHLQVRNHECSLCDKKYYKDKELQVHILAVHSTERPHKCRFEGCDKSFARHGNRYTHEQMHKTKFSCEVCAKEFSFRQNLQTHCRNIHGKIVLDTDKCKIEINK